MPDYFAGSMTQEIFISEMFPQRMRALCRYSKQIKCTQRIGLMTALQFLLVSGLFNTSMK
jgi:hypothetical protein